MTAGSTEEGGGRARPGVVLGVIGHDIHVVANRVLALGLTENGFRPFNIGTNTRIDDFVDATLETGSHAVLVSSINGEGETSCTDIGRIFAERGLADVLLYAGGNLVVGDRPTGEVRRIFTGYGFHRVFHRAPDFHGVFQALRQDLDHGNAQ